MFRGLCSLLLAFAAVAIVGCGDSKTTTSDPKLAPGSKTDPGLVPASAGGAGGAKSGASGATAVKGD